jgi:DNA-binding CsgD family transcriptional regulator
MASVNRPPNLTECQPEAQMVTITDRPVPGAPDTTAELALRQALLSGDVLAAEDAVHLLLRSGHAMLGVYDDLIQPLLDDVGARRGRGQLRLADEYVCSVALRELLNRVAAPQLSGHGRRGLVVLLAVGDERQLTSVMMVQQALIDDGWTVNRAGGLPLDEVPAYLDSVQDVRLFSVSVQEAFRPAGLVEQIVRLRHAVPRIPLILGGRALVRNPDLWRQVAADGGAVRVAQTLQLVDRLTNPLTDREVEIIGLASDGRTNKEIATGLGVTLSTVKTHLQRVYQKAGAHDRAGSVATALRRGWVT